MQHSVNIVRLSRYGASQAGFILIAVLGLISVLSLVAAFVAGYAEQRAEQALELKEAWQRRLDEQATLATVLHLITTRPRIAQGYQRALPDYVGEETTSFMDQIAPTLANSEAIVADDRPYQGLGSSRFALQDEGPLLSVLDPDRRRWLTLLESRGLSAFQVEQVLDQLLDYTDKDDLKRLNGATEADYQAKGLPLPSHRLMTSPGEMANLLSAPDWAWLPELLPLLTARSGQLLNINTMPAELLMTVEGLESETAQQLVTERQQQPFQSLSDANQRLGKILPLDEAQIPGIVSSYTRLKIWSGIFTACRQQKWIGISLSPTSKRAPWEIDYAFTFDNESHCQAVQPLVVAPLFPAPVAG